MPIKYTNANTGLNNAVNPGNGKISTALADNIAGKKQREGDLFDQLSAKDQAAYKEEYDENGKLTKLKKGTEIIILDNERKPITLTNLQAEIIYALSWDISRNAEDTKIKEYIRTLEAGLIPESKIERKIDLEQLSMLLFGSARRREIDKLVEELKTLAATYQYLIIPTSPGKKKVLMQPLLSFEAEGEMNEDTQSEATKKEIRRMKKLNGALYKANITYSSIFFASLTNSFTKVLPNLFSIWGKKGNGTKTEFWFILLSDVSSKHTQYTKAYYASLKTIKDKYKGKITKEAQKEINAIKDKLCYRVSGETLKERTKQDYSSNSTVKRRFVDEVRKCVRSLIEYGIVTDKTIVIDNKGKVIIDFYFNLDFGKKEDEAINEKGK